MSTSTLSQTIQSELNKANPNNLADLMRTGKPGNFFGVIKVVMTGGALAAYDITTAAFKALSTITGITLADGETLPPIRNVRSLRVTAATTGSTVGSYAITDASGTALTANTSAVTGLAKLSDDGKTLTFVTADVTAFVLIYEPQWASDLTSQFPPTS